MLEKALNMVYTVHTHIEIFSNFKEKTVECYDSRESRNDKILIITGLVEAKYE